MASAIDPDPTNFVVPVRALPIEARKYIPRIVTVFFLENTDATLRSVLII